MNDFETPKNMMTEETMHMLAEVWANKVWREYVVNARNQQIAALRGIKTGSIEGDALELSQRNGRINQLEDLVKIMKVAYEDVNKLKLVIKDK